MAFLGHLGPLRLLRPVGRDSRSVGHLGPFWPNPMRPKGAKGASHLGPKARWVPNHNWAHLSHFLAITPLDPKMTKNLMDTFLAMDHHGSIVQPWPLATTRGHQISSARLSPQLQGISSFPSYHPYSRLQAWLSQTVEL
ncbi:hypothetical protein O181_070286 [Austropuccinia psidii MF-1]|uniref:Uncharacterized protein n=1 Tax=Austropuccinia psidii MF-1 TaxID=1389203 RepID=A0A9Q3F540_9BASI|nr:hypothetical protein [Austropuccinia psidii MF-1]